MAFWLNRSGRQLVRLSSSWAATPKLRVLTSVNNNNNCFSTASSSGGMIQESNPKDAAAFKADMRMPTPTEYFGLKLLNDVLNDKPLLPPDHPDFDKSVDDLIEMLPIVNHKTKGSTSPGRVFADALAFGLLNSTPKPPVFKLKGDNFYFTLDTNGLYLIVNVSGLPKEDLVVWVDKQLVLITSTDEVAPDQIVREAIVMPEDHNYDPDEVTGTIMEDRQLKISFPISKEGVEPKEKRFKVNFV